jgi:hypothetical protein
MIGSQSRGDLVQSSAHLAMRFSGPKAICPLDGTSV